MRCYCSCICAHADDVTFCNVDESVTLLLVRHTGVGCDGVGWNVDVQGSVHTHEIPTCFSIHLHVGLETKS